MSLEVGAWKSGGAIGEVKAQAPASKQVQNELTQTSAL